MKKTTTGVGLTTLAVTLAAAAAHGGTDPGSWYVAPQILGVWADKNRMVDDDAGVQFAFGRALNKDWDLELAAFQSSHEAADGATLDLRGLGINVHRVFYRDARIHPYLSLGLGDLKRDGERSLASGSDLYASYGLGILADLAKRPERGTNVQLRAEILGRRAFDDSPGRSDSVDHVAGLGLQFSWGAPRPTAAAPAPAPEPAVAASPPPPSPPPPPADSDGDGVPDAADKCPNTPKGDRVDVNGCTIKGEIRLPRVVFETDKATLLPESYPILDEAAATLRKNPDLRIEVAGHTDSRGPDAYNQKLSERRAATVLKYLQNAGVANPMTSHGYGESQPIADNATDAGRQENRRVGLRILE